MDIEQHHEPDGGTSVMDQLVGTMAALSRARSAHDALEATVLAGLLVESGALGHHAGAGAELAVRAVAAEVGAALHMSDRTIQRRLSEAYTLVVDYPAVHAELAAGRITRVHTDIIIDAASPLPLSERAEFLKHALVLARAESPNRLRGMLASLAEEVRAQSITDRHRDARRARRITLTDLPDGMSELHLLMPATLAHAALDRITRLARTVRDRGDNPHEQNATDEDTTLRDERTMDQLRADIGADLLLAASPGSLPNGAAAIQGHVQVIVPALTLAAVTDTGAELAGTGPIDAEIARALAGAASGWDRVLTHPVTGAVLATDRYTPTADQRRTLRVRDQHCRFPGCRQPARRCDIDHSTAWQHGGTTAIDNLAHLCRRHHTLKHASSWTVQHLGGGLLQWTSPHGNNYTDTPTNHVYFRTTAEPPGRTTETSRAPRGVPRHGGTEFRTSRRTPLPSAALVGTREPAPF